MLKDKGLIIGIVLTVVLIAGGVYFMSRGSTSSSSSQTGAPVSSDILVPKGDYETSGLSGGNYLPATQSAKVTLVEFGDYECPACAEYHPFVKQLLTEFSGKINYVFRNFPLNQHTNAQISSQAAEAAGLQGKFWQMHDKLYESTAEWTTLADPKSIFINYATTFGLNIDKFKVDIDSQAVKDKIQSDVTDGNLINLNQTPTFYLNGVKIQNLNGTYNGLKSAVTSELSK